MIDASLNEVESLAAKAARGAGLDWGLCEDTGKCARWLATANLEWASSLCWLLDRHARLTGPRASEGDTLQPAAPDRLLSPLNTGGYLSDLGSCANTLVLHRVARPLWLLPFAASVAAARGAAMRISWADVSIAIWPVGGDVSGDFSELYSSSAPTVRWAELCPGPSDNAPSVRLDNSNRSLVCDGDWAALERLGAKTYVPASALSRATGAGSSSTDND